MPRQRLAYVASIAVSLYLAAVTAEIFIAIAQSKAKPHGGSVFATQALHPYYFFSLPWRKESLERINSAENWVDARGFRGPGPEARGNRKLAFLLGGSTAFGDGASTNDRTITSVLNRLQGEYFFVNAGVPSWNSFQELIRFLKQVQRERPSLVVHLNGFNDLYTAWERSGSELPADAPESFEHLERWVEDIRSDRVRDLAAESDGRYGELFLLTRIRAALFGRPPRPVPPVADLAGASAAADRYLENVFLVDDYARLRKIRHRVFFQPYAHASARRGGGSPPGGFTGFYLAARERIMKSRPAFLDDLSEALSENGPASDNPFFIDDVHFNDEGYERLAAIIWARLALAP